MVSHFDLDEIIEPFGLKARADTFQQKKKMLDLIKRKLTLGGKHRGELILIHMYLTTLCVFCFVFYNCDTSVSH